MADIVTTEARAILDALQPVEWYTTEDPATVVVSLDGDTALRIAVRGVPLPERSPYGTGDNRYPDTLLRPRLLTTEEATTLEDHMRTHGVPVAEFPCPRCGRPLGEHSDADADRCYPEEDPDE